MFFTSPFETADTELTADDLVEFETCRARMDLMRAPDVRVSEVAYLRDPWLKNIWSSKDAPLIGVTSNSASQEVLHILEDPGEALETLCPNTNRNCVEMFVSREGLEYVAGVLALARLRLVYIRQGPGDAVV